MKNFELKIKYESGRTKSVVIGMFETVSLAMKHVMTDPLSLFSKELSGAESMTIQFYKPKVSKRKNIQSRG